MTGGRPHANRSVRVAGALLGLASRAVPFARRGEWLAEWRAELWVLHRRGARPSKLLGFSLGGLAHALWERKQEEGGMMWGIGNDVRLAVRRLARSPGFTVVTVLVLALGVGANTALFSALRAALLDVPPYPSADRIVLVDMLLQSRAGVPADTITWSYPKFELARGRLGALESLAGYTEPTRLTLTGEGPASRQAAEFVTPAYFPILGVRPALGRLLTPDEEAPANAPVALLSYGFWTERFGGDPDILGRTVTLEGVPIEVVGVVEPGFRGLTGSADLWLPVAALTAIRGPRRLQLAWAHWMRAVGRLREGVSLEQARAEASSVGVALTEAYPDPDGGGAHDVTMVPFLRARVNPLARTAVTAVSAGAILFLLIACGNVAGLVLARASRRRTDVAVRAALGAGRRRLVREHLVESLILAGSGGALGLALAVLADGLVASAVRYALDTSGTRGLQFVDPDAMAVDGSLLLAGTVAALGTGLLFGLLPAWSASRVSPGADLRAGGGATLGGRRSRRGDAGRGVLVAVQLALTLVLLTGAGLMAASLLELDGVRAGFEDENVLTVAFERGPGSVPDENRAFVTALLEGVQGLPGVVRASVATCPPLAGRCEVLGLRRVDDGPEAGFGEMTGVLGYTASDEYFETLGVPVLDGRVFGADDTPDGAPVVLLNETAARTLLPGVSPLGHRISVTHELTAEGRMATVIGVVGDVRYASLEQEPMPAVYLWERQAAMSYGTLFVHTDRDPYALLTAVRTVAARLDPDLPLYDDATLADRHAAATARTRIILWLLAAFSASGLALCALGLYGLVSQAVTRRTAEVGLRMALGANRPGVVWMVVRRPVSLALVAVLVGLASAIAVTGRMEQLLYATSPGDVRVLAAVTVVLLAVALSAAWVPARRATRIAPSWALRSD